MLGKDMSSAYRKLKITCLVAHRHHTKFNIWENVHGIVVYPSPPNYLGFGFRKTASPTEQTQIKMFEPAKTLCTL